MKTSLKLTLLLIFISTIICAKPKIHWVAIGNGTYNHGFIYPYKIKFYVPYGVRNVNDIKLGLYPMKFKINWLLMKYSKKEVSQLFFKQLQENFKSQGNFRLYKNIVNSFLETLPAIIKQDEWDFIYSPDEGTRLYIKDKLTHHLVGSELNWALTQAWLNKDPVLTNKLLNRLLKVQK